MVADRPVEAQKLPTEQFTQAPWPALGWYVPAVQLTQFANDAPVVPRKVPVGQLVQLVEAAIT